MSSEFNRIQDNLKKKNISDIPSNELISYLYEATKNPNLKTFNKERIEQTFIDINYSFYFENIFVNKGNYSQISFYFVGLLIPFYLYYPRFYNVGTLAFFIGLISFLLLYQFIHTLYGNFFPSASRLFLIINIAFYAIFFLLFNKLNHISLFFISSIVSFCVINYFYRIMLTLPTKSNKYNRLRAIFEDKKNYLEYDYNLNLVCNEVIKRFGLKLPSGKMLYSYLTVFKIGENKNKISDFLTNLFSPFLTLLYNYFLGSFLQSLENVEYNGEKLVLPIIGINHQSKKYINCQANYVLPIEFNYSSYLHEFYQEKELDDDQYRIFIKCIKRINNEMISKYQPKFVKLENVDPDKLKNHMKKNAKDRNHILVQLENFFKYKEIIPKNASLSDMIDQNNYLESLSSFIKEADIKDDERNNALELFHKINQTLEIKTNFNKSEDAKKMNTLKNEYMDDAKLAIEVLLDNENIKDESKELLKNLSIKYIDHFRKNVKEDQLHGYNYNLWTFKYFDREYRKSSNNLFYLLIRIISVYILFSRPLSSPWLLSILALMPYISFEKYFLHYINDDYGIMKYLSMGVDTEYFKDEYKKIIKNNNILQKSGKLLFKFLFYIIFALPFLQFYNNTMYGLTFTPNYMNVIYQLVFILNLIGNFYPPFGWDIMSFNVIYWLLFFIITLILYFVFKKK